MKKKIIKRISYVLLTGLLVTNSSGCKSEKVVSKQVEEDNSYNTEQDSNIYQLNKEEQKTVIENENPSEKIEEIETEKIEETEKENIEEVIEEKYSDEDIVNYFSTKKADIISEKGNNVKQKAIDLFIEIADFIFYDKEIHGITYKELKEGAKENIVETFNQIDNFLCSIDPDYKESLEEKYKSVSEFISETYEDSKESFLENYGDITINDIYNEMEEIKEDDRENIDKIKDISSDAYENTKVKVKNWYENFRNNN